MLYYQYKGVEQSYSQLESREKLVEQLGIKTGCDATVVAFATDWETKLI